MEEEGCTKDGGVGVRGETGATEVPGVECSKVGDQPYMVEFELRVLAILEFFHRHAHC